MTIHRRRPGSCARLAGTLALGLAACGSEEPADGPPPAASGGGPRASETPWLVEVTDEVGLDFVHTSGAKGDHHLPEVMGGGCAFVDVDADGAPDVFLVDGGDDPVRSAARGSAANRLYRNAGGALRPAGPEAGVAGVSYGMGVAAGDVDGDGAVDLFVSNLGDDQLLVNRGDGTFADRTAAAGATTPTWSCSAGFFDYDRDGRLDLFVTEYVEYDASKRCFDFADRPDYCGPTAFPPLPDRLFRNQGDGRFADVSEAAGIAGQSAAGLGVVFEDFDEDGWPDVYVANDGYANHLWTNQGDGRFVDDALVLGAALNMHGQPEAGMGVVSADLDGDDLPDLFMTHLYDETNTLYRNLGAGQGFVDGTGRAGMAASSIARTGFGTVALDLELDGDLDLLVANGRVLGAEPDPATELGPPWDRYAEPNLLYLNRGDGRFDLAAGLALGFCARSEVSRGLAKGDLDGDGDLDVLLANLDGPARLFRNDAPREGGWLLVDARDPRRGRSAIGARVSLELDGRTTTRTLSPASSYLSSSDPRVHLRLPRPFGDAERERARLRVRWPDGRVERFPLGAANAVVVLERGSGEEVP
jgi:hypothetical protein